MWVGLSVSELAGSNSLVWLTVLSKTLKTIRKKALNHVGYSYVVLSWLVISSFVRHVLSFQLICLIDWFVKSRFGRKLA